MKPRAFAYHAPDTLAGALALLGDGVVPLAGGQTLVPLLNMRLTQPDAVVDLNRVVELAGIRLDGGELAIGAMTRHMAFLDDQTVARHVPLLAETAHHIAHLQIRTRGTIGGSLATAATAAEWPAAMAALDARVVIESAGGGRRVLPVGDFFEGAMTTALRPGELLVEIRIALPDSATGWAFQEFARRHGDFALAGAAVLVRRDGDGRIDYGRVAMCGCALPGMRLASVERALVGTFGTEADLAAAEALVRDTVDVPDDFQMTAGSRRIVAGTIVRRALERALARARPPTRN